MLSVTHIMPVQVLLSVVTGGVGMQQCTIQNRNEMHKLDRVEMILKTNK